MYFNFEFSIAQPGSYHVRLGYDQCCKFVTINPLLCVSKHLLTVYFKHRHPVGCGK